MANFVSPLEASIAFFRASTERSFDNLGKSLEKNEEASKSIVKENSMLKRRIEKQAEELKMLQVKLENMDKFLNSKEFMTKIKNDLNSLSKSDSLGSFFSEDENKENENTLVENRETSEEFQFPMDENN